jgi:hypothetical protein
MAASGSPLRRLVLRMVVLILLVDAIAIGIFHVANLEQAERNVRLAFTIGWTLVTLAIVLTSLRQIRMERNRIRRGGGRR